MIIIAPRFNPSFNAGILLTSVFERMMARRAKGRCSLLLSLAFASTTTAPFIRTIPTYLVPYHTYHRGTHTTIPSIPYCNPYYASLSFLILRLLLTMAVSYSGVLV